MDITRLVKIRIKNLLAEKNLPMQRLATYSGIPASTLKNIIYSKSTNPGIETIYAICNGLDMSLSEFFSSVEFTEPWTINEQIQNEK
jgi:transcriptional regulator with XRE-family HTH domain